MPVETEVKLRVTAEELRQLREKLDRLGVESKAPRQDEKNRLFDYPDGRLRKAGATLRMRVFGSRSILTFKGPVQDDPRFKKRPEYQTEVQDYAACEQILSALGLFPAARYDKVREILHWNLDAGPVEVCLDETPIGEFVELEGEPAAIQQGLEILGWGDRESIRRSYVQLYEEAGVQ